MTEFFLLSFIQTGVCEGLEILQTLEAKVKKNTETDDTIKDW